MIKYIIILAVVASVVVATINYQPASNVQALSIPTFVVERGELIIDVLEPGELRSRNSHSIRIKVAGRSRIVSIIEEGHVITKEDVENGLTLVQLDDSELIDERGEQEISVENARASLAQAVESLEIRKKTNESNLKQAQLKVKFALMDLQKYVGEDLAAELVSEKITVADLIDQQDRLGGEMLQTRRDLESKISLQEEELARAENTYEGTQELADRGYVTLDELRADKLAMTRTEVQLEQARLTLDLFRRYEYVKRAEQLLSDYQEALIDLERVKSRDRAELSKSEVELKSAETKYEKQKERLDYINLQLEYCTIRAERPGLVIYSDGGRRDPDVEEGAEVQERQEIIEIPDTTEMDMIANIHESAIGMIDEGQRAEIKVDSLPDETFSGVVSKVALLPNSQRWFNPDIKVYRTEIALDQTDPRVKPGMSGQALIVVEKLSDAIFIPLQAAQAKEDRRFVYVRQGDTYVERDVELGIYNDRFIEVRKGLKEGEIVAMRSPKPAGS